MKLTLCVSSVASSNIAEDIKRELNGQNVFRAQQSENQQVENQRQGHELFLQVRDYVPEGERASNQTPLPLHARELQRRMSGSTFLQKDLSQEAFAHRIAPVAPRGHVVAAPLRPRSQEQQHDVRPSSTSGALGKAPSTPSVVENQGRSHDEIAKFLLDAQETEPLSTDTKNSKAPAENVGSSKGAPIHDRDRTNALGIEDQTLSSERKVKPSQDVAEGRASANRKARKSGKRITKNQPAKNDSHLRQTQQDIPKDVSIGQKRHGGSDEPPDPVVQQILRGQQDIAKSPSRRATAMLKKGQATVQSPTSPVALVHGAPKVPDSQKKPNASRRCHSGAAKQESTADHKPPEIRRSAQVSTSRLVPIPRLPLAKAILNASSLTAKPQIMEQVENIPPKRQVSTEAGHKGTKIASEDTGRKATAYP